MDIYPGTVVWNICKKSFNGSIPEFSYSKIKSFNDLLKLPSPNPRFERSELKLLEAWAYSKVYNDERISRILMSVRSEFDRKKAIQMFNSKKKFIKDNYKLLCKAGLILTIIKKTITGA